MKFKLYVIVIILFLFYQATQAQESSRPLLNGNIETDAKLDEINNNASANHSLQPMPNTLQAGCIYNENNLPKTNCNDLWFWIPKWRAGEFLRKFQTNFTPNGPVTFKSEVTHFYGFQTDAKNQIWNFVSYPYKETVNIPGLSDIKLVIFFEPNQISNDYYSIHCITNDILVDNQTRQITKSYKTEEYQAFKRLNKNIVQAQCRSQNFDSQGQPISSFQKYIFTEERIQNYSPSSFWNGINLRLSFNNYLISHNLKDLIPVK